MQNYTQVDSLMSMKNELKESLCNHLAVAGVENVIISATGYTGSGGFEIRYTKAVRFRSIKETKPLGMALVLSKANMRSVDPIFPLKI